MHACRECVHLCMHWCVLLAAVESREAGGAAQVCLLCSIWRRGPTGQGKEQGRDALIFSSTYREREDEGGELMMCFVLALM